MDRGSPGLVNVHVLGRRRIEDAWQMSRAKASCRDSLAVFSNCANTGSPVDGRPSAASGRRAYVPLDLADVAMVHTTVMRGPEFRIQSDVLLCISARAVLDVYCSLDRGARVRAARDARQLARVLEVSWQNG